MDSISKFEKILNLVERVRQLDLITVQVIGTINQQQLNLYRDIKYWDTNQYAYQPQAVPNVVMEKRKTENESMDKEKKTPDNMSADEMMDFLNKAMENMRRIKENPPSAPQPPKPDTPVKDTEELSKIKQISATVAEHLRIQIDLHKYAAAAIHETHKLSFDLYKQIDSYMKQEEEEK